MDHRPIQSRSAPDIPDTRRPAYLQAKHMRSADHFRPVTGEQRSRFKSNFANPFSCITLEGSQSQETPGSLMTNGMHCPDLKAQLRMMPPALQEYVRELQMKAQRRENTSQVEDEDEAGTGSEDNNDS